MKIFGTRMSLIGDIIMSLPVLEVLCSTVADPYVYFSIAQKCQQAAPLFEGHPCINEIKISDGFEELGPKDQEIINQCDIVLPVRPAQPEQYWYNKRSLIAQTTLMAGFRPEFTHGVMPRLYLNGYIKTYEKHIAIWPFAGYGRGLERSPSGEWWRQTVSKLLDNGYHVLHFGVDDEPVLSDSKQYIRLTKEAFVSQVYIALGCDLAIGTDSGSMWVMAAYHRIPQINLMTNWLPNHYTNKLALAPVGEKCHDLYADGGCSNIPVEGVINKVNEILRS